MSADFLPPEIESAVQGDFQFLVVLGSSGSGKTRLCREIQPLLAGYEDSQESQQEEERWFDRADNVGKAVISHPQLDSDKLSAVGFNKIPSWCRPFGCLSNGEQSRVRLALNVRSAAILDDFAAVVDPDLAASMATGLAKLAKASFSTRIVVATTKPEVVTFLQPDYVILARSREIIKRPSPSPRKPLISVTAPGMDEWDGSSQPKRWKGELDEARDLDAEAATLVGRTRIRDGAATRVEELSIAVDIDDKVRKAAGAFDFDFTGTSETEVHSVIGSHPVYSGKVGYIFGPSGSGKTTALRKIVQGQQSQSRVFSEQDLDGLSPNLSTVERLQLVGGAAPGAAEALSAEQLQNLADRVGFNSTTAARPYRDLSKSEQHRSDVLVLLSKAAASSTSDRVLQMGQQMQSVVCIDEFTSSMDRKTAMRFATQVRKLLEEERAFRAVSLIVAGLFPDVLSTLQPSWALNSLTGTVSKRIPEAPASMSPQKCDGQARRSTGLGVPRPPTPQRFDGAGSSSSSSGQQHESAIPREVSASDIDLCDGDQVLGLFEPIRVTIAMRKLKNYHSGIKVWESTFEKHHYLQGHMIKNGHYFLLRVLPGESRVAHPALQCFREDAAIGFLATSVHVGAGSQFIMVEKRLVVLPEFQGFGIGPKTSAAAGERHLANGFPRYNSCTAHPRLGQSRDTFEVVDEATGLRHKLWEPNLNNGKASGEGDLSRNLLEKANANRKRPMKPAALLKQRQVLQKVPRVMFRHHYKGTNLRRYEEVDKKYRDHLAERQRERDAAKAAKAAGLQPKPRDVEAIARELAGSLIAQSRQNSPARGPAAGPSGKRPRGRPPKNGVYNKNNNVGTAGGAHVNSNANAARARPVDRLGAEEFTPFASMSIGGRAPRARPAATASSGILPIFGAPSSSSNRNPALPPAPNARADRAIFPGESSVSINTTANSSSSRLQMIEDGGCNLDPEDESQGLVAAMAEIRRREQEQAEKYVDAITTIAEMCDIEPEEATEFLQMYDWDVQRAATAALEQQEQEEEDMSQLQQNVGGGNASVNVGGASSSSCRANPSLGGLGGGGGSSSSSLMCNKPASAAGARPSVSSNFVDLELEDNDNYGVDGGAGAAFHPSSSAANLNRNGPPPGKEAATSHQKSAAPILVDNFVDEEDDFLLRGESPDNRAAKRRRVDDSHDINNDDYFHNGDAEFERSRSQNFAGNGLGDVAPAMDQMSEEEQFKLAMELSLQESGGCSAPASNSAGVLHSGVAAAPQQHQHQADALFPEAMDAFPFGPPAEQHVDPHAMAPAAAPSPAGAPAGVHLGHGQGQPAAQPAPGPGGDNDIALAIEVDRRETEQKVEQIMAICGVSRDAAAVALRNAGGVVDTAVLQLLS